MTVPTPRPPILPVLAALPQPRRLTARRASHENFTAVCPHGRDTEWLAVRDDDRSHVRCPCTCPEVAA